MRLILALSLLALAACAGRGDGPTARIGGFYGATAGGVSTR
ncbi:hypothetical protein [Roseomonas haemaphysalidis]|nr:hypothetical protein [Roseomonas haemaphysalidis]